MKSCETNQRWQDIPLGGILKEPGNAERFNTGDWRSEKPIWLKEKCKQCGLCFPTCPDSSIMVDSEALVTGFDYEHCKGCGVCSAVCPFNAITMEQE